MVRNLSIGQLAVISLSFYTGILASPTAFSFSTQLVGNNNGAWFSRECPAGEVLVGWRGKVGRWVDGIELECAEPVNNRWSVNRAQHLPPIGGDGGNGSGEQRCRTDSAITRIDVRLRLSVANYVSEIRSTCSRLSGLNNRRNGPSIRGTDATVTPTPLQRLQCPSNSVAVGLSGRSGLYIDAIRLDCKPLSGGYTTDTTVEAGGNGGEPRTVSCPAGHRIVGLLTGTHEGVGNQRWLRRLQPICGALPTWNAQFFNVAASVGVAEGVRRGPGVGKPGGTRRNLQCPSGQYVYALETHHDRYVHGVRLWCRTPDYQALSRPTRRAGRAAGNQDLLQCPADALAQALVTRRGEGLVPAIDSLRLRCRADEDRKPPKLIAIFGDSFAAGEGAPDIGVSGGMPPTIEGSSSRSKRAAWADRLCHRSNWSGLTRGVREYVASKGAEYKFRNFACSGAKITTGVTSPQHNPPESDDAIDPQVEQAKRWMRDRGHTRIDTLVLMIGGNDAGFGGHIASCISAEAKEKYLLGLIPFSCATDPAFTAGLQEGLQRLSSRLDDTTNSPTELIDAVRQLNPRRVFFVTYPNPLLDSRGSLCGQSGDNGPRPPFPSAEAEAWDAMEELHEESLQLVNDDFIPDIKQRMNAAGRRFGWIMVNDWEGATSRAGYCTNDQTRMFNLPSDTHTRQGNIGGIFHPNTRGYGPLARIMETALVSDDTQRAEVVAAAAAARAARAQRPVRPSNTAASQAQIRSRSQTSSTRSRSNAAVEKAPAKKPPSKKTPATKSPTKKAPTKKGSSRRVPKKEASKK